MFLTRSANFSSPLGDRVQLYSMTGRETLGQLFTYEVDLLSPEDNIDLSELLGQGASVVFERTDGSFREFTGYVTQFSLVGEHSNQARYRATLRPWLWFLAQNRNSRIFQHQSVPEIVLDLFREHGFTDVENLLSGQYEKWEFLVQYRESDFNFISRMLEHEGIYYYFTHADGRHKLVLADSAAAHEAPPGYELIPYFPPMERERRQDEHFDSWILSRQIRQGHVVLRDFNYLYPLPFESNKKAQFKEPGSTLEQYDYPAQINAPDGDKAVELTTTRAEIRMEEHQADYETVRGAGPVRGLFAGAKFALTQYPREDQNKEYLVVSAGYEIQVGEFESNNVRDAEPLFRFQLSAIDAKRPYRSPRVTPKPRVEGPQTATVVGDEGKEITTDEFGRVRVLFHWDRYHEYNSEASCMVRVSQSWAGFGWGSFHLPRHNQEVIVDFLEGDPDRPIITGRVYNNDNMPPYGDKNGTQSGFKSHSTPGGGPDNFNEIRFEDKKGEEDLHVQAEKDMSTLIKHDRTTTILRNDTLNITGDQFIKIHGNLSMIVEGVTEKDNPDKAKPVKSSLGVTGAHRIDASDTIDIQAPNKITLTVGGSTITITPGSITLSAGGSTVAIDANVFAQSKGQSHMMLDANAFLQSSGKGSLLLDANACTQSSGGSQLLLDGDASLSSGGGVNISGKTVTGAGTSELALSGGGGGKVTLNAGSAELGGPQTTVSSDGVTSVSGSMVKIG
jgi:type VI secretion system secreted protein VgrG